MRVVQKHLNNLIVSYCKHLKVNFGQIIYYG